MSASITELKNVLHTASLNSLHALREHKMTLVTAESCTGGMLSEAFTSHPGASAVFLYGVTAYGNEAKSALLNVPSLYFTHYGAVSEETAKAMAEGALSKGKADIAVSVTGIAGPEGGSPQKPVGTVYIGFAYKGRPGLSSSAHFRFNGDRESVRLQAAAEAARYPLACLANAGLLPQSARA